MKAFITIFILFLINYAQCYIDCLYEKCSDQMEVCKKHDPECVELFKCIGRDDSKFLPCMNKHKIDKKFLHPLINCGFKCIH